MQQAFASPAGRPPFRLSIDPDQAFLQGGWRFARDAALAAVLGEPRLIFITGEPGTGKSLLLLALANALKVRHRPALQLRRGDIPVDERDRAILLVDEGDRLDDTARERIVVRARSFPCVVAGSPSLAVWFGDAARGSLTIPLSPMPPEEVGPFLADRLARAGLPPDLFASDAVAQLTVHARGIPRVLAMLAGSAWFIAGAAPDKRITADHIVQAVTLRDGVPPASIALAAASTAEIVPLPIAPSESPSAVMDEAREEAASPVALEPDFPPYDDNVPSMPAPSEIPIAVAAMSEIRAPVGIPPYRRVSSLASRPFRAATAFTALTIIALVTFLDRGTIEKLSTIARGSGPERTASIPAPVAPPSAAPPAPARAQPTEPAEEPRPSEGSSSPPPSAATEASAPTPAANISNEPVRTAAVQAAPPPASAHPTTRVVVRYRQGDAGSRRRAAAVAGRLREIGLHVDDPSPVGQRFSRAKLQYFFDEDRAAATAIAAYLGPRFGAETLGNPSDTDPAVQPGTVEIWVPPARLPPRHPPPEESDDESE